MVILWIWTSQGGGYLRIIFNIDGNDSSVGYYHRSDSRSTVAGDMWVSGVNIWNRVGSNIGTPVLNSCLNISDSGAATADVKLRTPLIQTDIIRGNGADQVTIDADVIITGNLVLNRSFEYKPLWLAGTVYGNGVIQSSTGR